MIYPLRLDERTVELEVLGRRPELRVRVDDTIYTAIESPSADGTFNLDINGQAYRGFRSVVGEEVHVRLGARTFVFGLTQTPAKAPIAGSHELEIHADMPGVVIAVHCIPGQRVNRGDALLTMESMKLQMTIAASHDGTVERVHVVLEASFQRGALLVSFERPVQGA